MEEIFYEDILETFLFCFIAVAGVIQIMAARRRWHGLSVYGGRLRPAVNYVLGTALIVFAYAWYFSDPLHRNVRNIEAFMSIFCLALGIVAAGAATALLASAAEAVRRRFGRGREGRKTSPGAPLERIDLPVGTALLSAAWGERGKNLVVVAEPGRGSEHLARSLYAAMSGEHGMLCLQPHRDLRDIDIPARDAAEADIMGLLSRVERERGMDLRGETFLGLGWEGNALYPLGAGLEKKYGPRKLMMVAPVVPDCEKGLVGDALHSDTPLDVLATFLARRPWKEEAFGRMLRAWLPVLAACVVLATAVTVGFGVRWKWFSGPMVGLILSLWVTYFLVRRRGAGVSGSREERLVSRLRDSAAHGGETPFTVVLTSGDPDTPATPPLKGALHGELWEDVLRGKFILDRGTPERLAALIWEGDPGEED